MTKFLRLSQIFSFVFLFYQCQIGSGKKEIILTNISEIDLTDKAISIQRSQINDLPEGKIFPLLISSEGDTLSSQIDDLDGDNFLEICFPFEQDYLKTTERLPTINNRIPTENRRKMTQLRAITDDWKNLKRKSFFIYCAINQLQEK